MKLTVKHYLIFTAKVLSLATVLFVLYWGMWAISGQYPSFDMYNSIQYFIIFSTVATMAMNYIKNNY